MFTNNFVSLIRQTEQTELIREYSLQIFNKYVQCHLSEPDGLRVNRSYEEEEEDTQPDRELYKEQLIIIGHMGRINVSHSLGLLSKLLENKIRHLQNYLQQTIQAHGNNDIAKMLENVFEDLHWLLLISGHVLCMEASGEQPLIPSEIMLMSHELITTGKVNIETSLKVLASPNEDCIGQIPNAENLCDPIIRIISAVLRLAEVENKTIEYKMSLCLSTEVTTDIIWLINFWSESYLFMSTEYYTTMSETLKTAFGADTPGGKWMLDYILNKICINVQNFSTENNIVQKSVGLFVSLVKSKQK